MANMSALITGKLMPPPKNCANGEDSAGGAPAARANPIVPSLPRPFGAGSAPPPSPRGPRVPRRQHAVHRVDAGSHGLDHVHGMSHAHEVARLRARERGAVPLDPFEAELAPLAHPESAQRVAVERHRREPREAARTLR